MKQFKIVLTLALLAVIGFTSCEKMLYVESDRYLYTDNNQLDSPNDSVYSMVGILSKLQLLGDQYVFLGELRADLMDVTHNAHQDLIDLTNLDYSNPDNEYLNLNNYYAVINHCNYLITNMDSSLVVEGELRLKREVVAAKAVRAWTYLQMALNYNGAYYYEQPILTVEQSQEIAGNQDYFFNREEIFQALIADLTPYMDYPVPDYEGLPDAIIPSMRYILGEIYLWQNNYAQAAEMYYWDIYNLERTVHSDFSARVMKSGNMGQEYSVYSPWMSQFNSRMGLTPEVSAGITYYYTNKYGNFNTSKLRAYTTTEFKVAPSKYAVDWFNAQSFMLMGVTEEGERVNVVLEGDVRGKDNAFSTTMTSIDNMDKSDMTSDEIEMYENDMLYHEPVGTPYISLYNYVSEDKIFLQRSTMAYLRYAEAMNRAGKPDIALAVVNYGLKPSILSDSTLFANPDTAYVAKWNKEVFTENTGVRTRGQGASNKVGYFFTKDSADLTLMDTILFVEQVLVDECGFESAFQGNRFHDLLRFTHHDGAPNYIGNVLGKKFPERAAEFAAKGVEDWFIPYPTTQE